MATNIIYDGVDTLSLVASHPTTPTSGAPVRVGSMTGTAETDERADGTTTINLGWHVADVSVKAVDGSGDSAVALYDAIYYVDADTPALSKKTTGTLYGLALETVLAGATDTIKVLHMPPGVAPVTAATLSGTQVATVANANLIGGIPVLHRIDIADAATGDVDTVLTHKTRVIDAWFVKTAANAAAANTIQVFNGSNAVTDAMNANINDTLIVRAGSINDANHEIAAGGTLKVTRTKAGGNAAGIVYVYGLRVA